MAKTTSKILRNLALVGALGGLCGAAAFAQSGGTVADAEARYQKEMAACKNGTSTNQDQPTCEREARNALAEFKRGQLDNGDAKFRKNARERCDVLQGDDRKACLARARGEGSVEGSVAGGGILRETVTPVAPVPTKP